MRYGKIFHELMKASEMSHSCEMGVISYLSYTEFLACVMPVLL